MLRSNHATERTAAVHVLAAGMLAGLVALTSCSSMPRRSAGVTRTAAATATAAATSADRVDERALAEIFASPDGQTYRVIGCGDTRSIPAFDEHGMVQTIGSTAADVTVELELGDLRQCEPSAMRTNLGFVPAFALILPYTITIRHADDIVARDSEKYTRLFRFDGNAAFPTRDEAIQAIRAVRELAQRELDDLARGEALRQARATIARTTNRLVAANHAAAPTR